jgi:Transcriptional regulators
VVYCCGYNRFRNNKCLKGNGRATSSEVSKRVNLSIPAVSERIRKMEESGLIEKYTIKVNRNELVILPVEINQILIHAKMLYHKEKWMSAPLMALKDIVLKR